MAEVLSILYSQLLKLGICDFFPSSESCPLKPPHWTDIALKYTLSRNSDNDFFLNLLNKTGLILVYYYFSSLLNLKKILN